MKNEKAKGLFLLCSVFPEDEELSTEILTRFPWEQTLLGKLMTITIHVEMKWL